MRSPYHHRIDPRARPRALQFPRREGRTSVKPRYLIVILGSAGSLRPLVEIVRQLPPNLDAAVVVLIHRGARSKSYLSAILSRAGRLSAALAVDREELERGRIYVAPAGDRHTVVEGRTVRLVAGPKVRFLRPAGDPLLYSAAVAFGPRAVAVILSGMGQDGEAGAAAIKRAGGTVLVQSISEAAYPSMPRYAMAVTEPDACLATAEIASRLAALGAPVASAA
jgi:two-component system chemotaxis response regulator CheB